jgi:hypothetical protein
MSLVTPWCRKECFYWTTWLYIRLELIAVYC